MLLQFLCYFLQDVVVLTQEPGTPRNENRRRVVTCKVKGLELMSDTNLEKKDLLSSGTQRLIRKI
jgi:hypothetical protein